VNEEHKKEYHEKYAQEKQKGVKFYPDIIYKDLIVAFGIFILLIGLATFVGVANEPPADPSDSSYIPRPEWYFLFLFEMLKYFPGAIEWIGTAIIPGLAVLALFLLPFFDRNPKRYWKKRKFAVASMTIIVIGMVALTVMAAISTPPQEETGSLATTISEKIVVGSDLYSVYCVECHGPDGEGGEIVGVEGLEDVIVKPINSQDEMYTRSDTTLYDIINYGQPTLGMPPNGIGYGGELGPGEMEAIVVFMRYTWDDRAEVPAEASVGFSIPPLAEGEVPSYEVHIAPLVKRFCVSCHRPGKENGNYLMGTFQEIMETGDYTPNVIPGDLGSNLIRMLYREEIDAGGPMPPSKPLPEAYIKIFELWVLGGAPNTADEAAAASSSGDIPEAVPEESAEPTSQPQ